MFRYFGEREYDIVVSVPHKRRYAIKIEIKSIKKAEPKIVELEQ